MIVTVARVWTDGSVVRVCCSSCVELDTCVRDTVAYWCAPRVGWRCVCLVADKMSLRGRRVVGCVYSSPVTGVCVILVHASCRRREIVGAGSMIIEVCFHCIGPGVG